MLLRIDLSIDYGLEGERDDRILSIQTCAGAVIDLTTSIKDSDLYQESMLG